MCFSGREPQLEPSKGNHSSVQAPAPSTFRDVLQHSAGEKQPRTRATGFSVRFSCRSRYLNSLTEPLISSKRNLSHLLLNQQNANEKPGFPESIFFQKLTGRAAPEPTGSHYSCEFIRGENCLTAKMLQGVPRLRPVPKCQTQCASVCHLLHFPQMPHKLPLKFKHDKMYNEWSESVKL